MFKRFAKIRTNRRKPNIEFFVRNHLLAVRRERAVCIFHNRRLNRSVIRINHITNISIDSLCRHHRFHFFNNMIRKYNLQPFYVSCIVNFCLCTTRTVTEIFIILLTKMEIHRIGIFQDLRVQILRKFRFHFIASRPAKLCTLAVIPILMLVAINRLWQDTPSVRRLIMSGYPPILTVLMPNQAHSLLIGAVIGKKRIPYFSLIEIGINHLVVFVKGYVFFFLVIQFVYGIRLKANSIFQEIIYSIKTALAFAFCI